MSEINPFEGIDEIIPEKSKKKKNKPSKVELKSAIEELPTATDNSRKAKLVYAIQKIGNNHRFSEYLKENGHRFDNHYLEKKTVKQLEFEIEKCHVTLANKSNNGMIDIVLKNGLRMGESILSSRTQFQVHGTTDQLFEDEHFLDLVERIKLKHSLPFFEMSPELELCLTVAQTALMVHQSNKFKTSLTTDIDLDQEIGGLASEEEE